MTLSGLQRYPSKLCLKFEIDIHVFCLFKLLFGFSQKITWAFLAVKKQRRKYFRKKEVEPKNDGIFHIFDQIKESRIWL